MRPRPHWGQGWRKGDYHHYEKRISPEQLFSHFSFHHNQLRVLPASEPFSRHGRAGTVSRAPYGFSFFA
jgi:hypothetical protein